jgi:hypothetical protein
MKFRDHGIQITALGQVMPVAPVVARNGIVTSQRLARSNRNGFLTDAQVNRGAHFIIKIFGLNPFFDSPNA